jgi:hypothetical protein
MDVIDRYYFQMILKKREHIFVWITPKLNMKHQESNFFYATYNPENQYLVKTLCQEKEEDVEAFLFDEKYMFTSVKEINEDYVLSIDKLVI